MKLCRERIALMICGTTVSSYPTMPGKTESSPFSRNRATRLSRNSSFTWRERKRSSENWLRRRSPNVRGTLMNGTPRNYNGFDYTPAVAAQLLRSRLGIDARNHQSVFHAALWQCCVRGVHVAPRLIIAISSESAPGCSRSRSRQPSDRLLRSNTELRGVGSHHVRSNKALA